MTLKLTSNAFVQKCHKIHNHKYTYPNLNYISGANKISVHCSMHGMFQVLAGNHLYRKSGCPLCANKIRNINNKKSHETALKDIENRNNLNKNNKVYLAPNEIYIDARKKYNWVCDLNHKWVAKFGDVVFKKSGCRICAINQRAQTNVLIRGIKYPTQIKTSTLTHTLDNKHWLIQQHHVKQHTLEHISHCLGISITALKSRLTKYNIKKCKFPRSQCERDLHEFLKTLTNVPVYEINVDNIIARYELDFYFPIHKFAIELNGVHWHSELSGRGESYHFNKYKQCKNKNITLLQFWEYEWIEKQHIIKSKIALLTGNIDKKIYARNCVIKELDNHTANIFFTKTHLQGYIDNGISIGLFYNDQLVNAMIFLYNNNQYELIRFSSELNTIVIGGNIRLFNFFIKKYNVQSIISYCNLRYGTDTFYHYAGFSLLYISQPNYFYFHNNDDKIIYSCEMHKLPKNIKPFDPKLTQWENMKLNGYDRIWDCGNSVYVWNKQ